MTTPDDERRLPGVREIPPEEPMVRPLASLLLAHLNLSEDPRIQTTPENVTVWTEQLAEYTFGECLDAAHGYYGSYDPKHPDRDKLGMGLLRHLVRERCELAKRKARQLEPPKGKPGRMYRDTLLRCQQRGQLTDRDPADYPERPTGVDPTRERHP